MIETIKTKRLTLKQSSRDELIFLDDLQRKCNNYFSFDPKSSTDDVSMEECLISGSLPPYGIKENYSMYSIYFNEKIIGYFDIYIGYPKKFIAYISIMFIEEAYRNNGFGKEIIEELCKEFKSIGLLKIRLGVSLRNWTGFTFWFKNGFDKVTKIRCDGNCAPDNFGVVELEKSL